MTTPYDIITRAMKDIGALAAGENPTADEAQDGLDLLNDMIAQWSNENMMVFYRTEIVFPCVQNQVQYTIGPAGNVSARFVGSISGTFHRHVIAPGDDYSAEDDRVKAVCAAVHTPEVIAAYQAMLQAQKPVEA